MISKMAIFWRRRTTRAIISTYHFETQINRREEYGSSFWITHTVI